MLVAIVKWVLAGMVIILVIAKFWQIISGSNKSQ